MVEAHCIDEIEIRQIVLIRHVIPVPGDDVQRRMIDRRCPESSLKLGHNPEIAFAIFKLRYWSQKVARIRQPVRANRPQIRQTKQRTIVLADITARFFLQKFDAKTNFSLDLWNLA